MIARSKAPRAPMNHSLSSIPGAQRLPSITTGVGADDELEPAAGVGREAADVARPARITRPLMPMTLPLQRGGGLGVPAGHPEIGGAAPMARGRGRNCLR